MTTLALAELFLFHFKSLLYLDSIKDFLYNLRNTPTILHHSTYKEVNWHIDHWHFTISTLFPHIFFSHYENILAWTSMPSMQQRTTSTLHTLWINALNGCSLPFFFLYTKNSSRNALKIQNAVFPHRQIFYFTSFSTCIGVFIYQEKS